MESFLFLHKETKSSGAKDPYSKLSQDVAVLGLPQFSIPASSSTLNVPFAGMSDKSANKLTIKDVEAVGWYIDTSSDTKTFSAEASLRSKYQDAPATDIIAKIIIIRKNWLVTEGDSLQPISVAPRYLDFKKINKEIAEDINPVQNMEFYNFNLFMRSIAYAQERRCKPGGRQAVFRTGGDRDKTDYPAPNFIFPLKDIRKDPSQAINKHYEQEGAINSILKFTLTDLEYVTELAVERLIDAALTGIFHIPKSRVMSGEKVNHPRPLRMNDSYSMPDLASARIGDKSRLGQEFQPVLIIGEPKVRKRGLEDDDSKQRLDKPDARPQMAVAAHGTMVLLILRHLIQTYGSVQRGVTALKDNANGTWKLTMLPDHFFLYGIYYDESKVQIFVHFPTYKKDEWCFHQICVANFDLRSDTRKDEAEHQILDRFRLAVALFTVRRHAEKLADELGSIVTAYKA